VFPTEKMNNVNLSNPIATMQTGIITSFSNYYMENKAPKYLIRHNLPATGGASGSPMFAPNGEVVAIHWTSNYLKSFCQKKLSETKTVPVRCRMPNAAMIKFAERADLLYAGKWEWKTIQLD
tara:strand:+ start:341 stop:706 length:366 start_codon:yes stop_codon:yes gene_type:complete